MTMNDHHLTSMMNQARDLWFSKVYIYWNDCLFRERGGVQFSLGSSASSAVLLWTRFLSEAC